MRCPGVRAADLRSNPTIDHVADWIRVRGARTHNLRDLDLDIPRGRIVALVGVSGAGKSSLALHTLYAEGYSRYMESISPYIRQFLDKLARPQVDEISGLPPAVAVRYRGQARNPRSTVATSIDLYDYFRILFARGAHFSCPGCGRPLRRWTVDEIVKDIMKNPGERVCLGFDYRGEIPFLVNRGYYFQLVDGKTQRLDALAADRDIQVLLDELDVSRGQRERLFEAVDRAISLGRDRVVTIQRGETIFYPTRLHCPHCRATYTEPDENLFSFNSPRGACPHCRGYGDILEPDPDKVFDTGLSLEEGAIRPLRSSIHRSFLDRILAAAGDRGIDVKKPLKDLSKSDRDLLMWGDTGFPGVEQWFRFYRTKRYKVQARALLSRYSTYRPCPECGGTRLNPEALAYTVKDRNLGELAALSIHEAKQFFDHLDPEELSGRVTDDVFREIRGRLEYLVRSGLGYIELNRLTFTLSRGEHQRLNMAFILGSTLSDSLLILDQPSADLHPAESRRIAGFLEGLRDAGNTVVMVEHDADMIKRADWVIELGPGAGDSGGRLVFSGLLKEYIAKRGTLAPRFAGLSSVASRRKQFSRGELAFYDLSAHNLKGFAIQLPRGGLTMICGVSGAGKTSLLRDELGGRQPLPEAITSVEYVDPRVPAAASRSGVAAFMGIVRRIREWYAAQPTAGRLGYTASHFSSHSPRGRCVSCRGRGGREVEMQFLPAVWIPCDGCGGSGLKPEVLKIRARGLNIVELLNLTIESAARTLQTHLPRVGEILSSLNENGLGYLRLSQPLSAMSDGERQRLKLCRHLIRGNGETLYLIDDPSCGLHSLDLEKVLDLFRRLTALGHTVVVADQNMELLSRCDWVIELGPGGGDQGGDLLFQGTLGDFLDRGDTLTARELKKKYRP